jgi:hypothetical protein
MENKKKTLLLSVILLFINFTYINGQINIEKQRNVKKGKVFGAVIGLSLALYKGNTDMFILNSNVRFDLHKGKNSGFLIGDLSYGEKNGESYLNKGFVHIRYIRNISKILMTETFAQMEFNDFILLNRRTLIGVGFKLRLLKNKIKSGDFKIYIGSGMMFENEKFDSSNNDKAKPETFLFKSTSYISLSYSSDKFTIKDVIYLQTNIGKDTSTRIYSDMQLSVKLSKKLSYTAFLTIDTTIILHLLLKVMIFKLRTVQRLFFKI